MARSAVPIRCRSPRRQSPLPVWPSAGVRLVIPVPEERRTDITRPLHYLPGMAGLTACQHPASILPASFPVCQSTDYYVRRCGPLDLLLTAGKHQTATQVTRPARNVDSIETPTLAHGRETAVRDGTALSHPQLVPAIYLADSCCCALPRCTRTHDANTVRNCCRLSFKRPRLVSCKHGCSSSRRTHTGPAHWKSTHTHRDTPLAGTAIQSRWMQ